MTAAAALPVTVIGGYLGAGKTTLVNHLLRHAGGRRLAVLVNDFGELPIDADLIEGSDGAVLAIAGGCVCCAYGSDLIEGLEAMAARRPRPDHVIVETSGVALPEAVAQSVQLLASYRRDAIIVVADVETAARQADDRYMGDTIRRQLAAADIVVASKADLVAGDALAAAQHWLGGAAPQAAVLPARRGALPPEALLGPPATDRLLLSRRMPHDAGRWTSGTFAADRPVDAERLAARLAEPAMGLVRAKGILAGRAGPVALQVVGRRWEVTPVADAPAAGGSLVAIAVGAPLRSDAIHAAIAEATLAEGTIPNRNPPSPIALNPALLRPIR